MANLKSIRKRITSVKSTQKITRAMKMVAGARLNRAQQRITAMRPYAISTTEVLREVVKSAESGESAGLDFQHPLLDRRPEKTRLLLVITSDRGLCGAFNTNICKRAEAVWRQSEAQGVAVKFCIIGRKGRDYFRRRGAPIHHIFESVWERLDLEQARGVARTVLAPFVQAEVDSITVVYNEFKSAMTQRVVEEALFPLGSAAASEPGANDVSAEFIFEPNQGALLERLVPMYVEISILRALYESMASELGARMTAMDAATKNAKEMIEKLTLKYNRGRQAAITTEILEIIGGAEALHA
ncbi:MAG TPA: ATP synthase F1 subunit gamma [Polyangiaceae bacterium]|nr:ATP synthase F1 subunit gamma [Polyangiaceae bacterium]